MLQAAFVVLFTSVAIRLSLSVAADADGFNLTPEWLDSSNSRSARTLPERVLYKLVFDESNVVLHLHRRHIRTNLSIYYGHREKSSTIQVYNYTDEDICFYQDKGIMASFSLKIPADPQRTTHDMTGTFYYNGSLFYMEPMHAVNSAAATHHLRRIAAHVGTVDYIRRDGKTRRSGSRPNRAGSVQETGRDAAAVGQRLSRAVQKPSYEVDLLYITDYSFFKRFESDVKVSRPNATLDQILREVRFYLAHVENQVDVRYRGIDIPDWKMTTNLVALYLETSQSNSFWTETLAEPSANSARSAVNATAALEKFTNWIRAVPPVIKSLPKFDHAALFTGYNIYGPSGSRGGKNYDTTGLAGYQEMCTPYSTSVIEFTGALTEGNTQAHELGHSLGASHDGDGNACLERDQYIMAATSSGTTESSRNSYRFSSCSIESFRDYVNSLNSEGSNCMLNTLPPFDIAEWQIDMRILPGTYYTIDDQCRQAYGLTYAARGGAEYGPNVCTRLWCYDTADRNDAGSISLLGQGGAADGTSCGDRKWCIRGACVYNSSAPANSDTCPHGDFSRDQKVFTNLPYSCSSLPSFLCYDAVAFNMCCKSCGDKYRPNATNCQFGDRVENCNKYSRYQCRFAAFKNQCCQFCQDNRLDIPNCEWGDDFNNCVPSMCKSAGSGCCQTCYEFTHPNWSPPIGKSQPATTVSETKLVAATLPNVETPQNFGVAGNSTEIVTTKSAAPKNFALLSTVDFYFVTMLSAACTFQFHFHDYLI